MKLEGPLSMLALAVTLVGCGKVDSDGGTGGAPGADGSIGSGGSGGSSACDGTNDNLSPCRDERIENCGRQELDRCTEVSYCQVLNASPIDLAAECVGDSPQDVGCGIIGCGARETRAEDPDGNHWYFPSTCIPYGWTDLGFPSGLGECSGLGGGAGAGP